MNYRVAFIIFFILIVLASGTYVGVKVSVPEHRYAVALEEDLFGDSAKEIIYLEQNWSAYDSQWFYNTTQGSNLIPYRIFLHLEQADGEELLRSNASMNRFRYLLQEPSQDNPDGLPVGFVKNTYKDKDYIGFTCAACHTNQLNYQGYGIRIDGGPTLADMSGFLLALDSALTATAYTPEKFERFAASVFKDDPQGDQNALLEELKQTQQAIDNYNKVNRPDHGYGRIVEYGYGRLDAFGRIYNRVLKHLAPEEPNNFNPPTAPVSYPFLWDTPQHDFVQWNGVGNNENAGGLGRNAGEVIGVFATFSLQQRQGDPGFRSSVQVRNIGRIEKHLFSLQSPKWPEVLPPIDWELAKKGEQVFVEYRCNTCHSGSKDFNQVFDSRNPDRRVIAQMTSLEFIGTDPTMANNAYSYEGFSGFFEGERIDPLKSEKFGMTTKVLPALSKATFGVLIEPNHDKSKLRRVVERIYDLVVSFFYNPIQNTQRHLDFQVVGDEPENLLAYKGRPLNGIWATAPYLHNGSVPNLYELFLPSCDQITISNAAHCRSESFTVGSREFDPVKVGYLSRDKTQYPGLFEFNTKLPSNSNKGHEYAAGVTRVIKLDENNQPLKLPSGDFVTELLPPISDEQRWALVEYLKTL